MDLVLEEKLVIPDYDVINTAIDYTLDLCLIYSALQIYTKICSLFASPVKFVLYRKWK